MTKIANLQIRSTEFNFVSTLDRRKDYLKAYSKHELGRIDSLIPWTDLIQGLRQRGYRVSRKGPRSLFDLKGKLGLMFLKSYLNGISDRELLERLNRDAFMQLFTNVFIPIDEPLTNFKLISAIRCELSPYLDIDHLQKCLFDRMRPYMDHPHIAHIDATVYESAIRYPTDTKLLMESCEWIYKKNRHMARCIGWRNIRSKYREIKRVFVLYQKGRRRTYKKTQRMRRRLLRLLNKLLHFQLEMLAYQGLDLHDLKGSYYKRLKAIVGVHCQQEHLIQGRKFADRIVSIDKPYLRPIVRGKETKRVEFGAKVHMVQISGMNFIELFSFDAYNESTRLINSVYLVRKLSGKITHLGADNIYPTNRNRKYCSENGITTSFVRKGRAGKLENQRLQIQAILAKDRATRLEGSFGVEKNNYGLSRIRARTKDNEKLCIFFGVHMANFTRLVRSEQAKRTSKQA